MPWQKAMLRDYRAMQPLAQVLRHIQGIPLGLQQQMLIYNEVICNARCELFPPSTGFRKRFFKALLDLIQEHDEGQWVSAFSGGV